jgi:hypothetical protein
MCSKSAAVLCVLLCVSGCGVASNTDRSADAGAVSDAADRDASAVADSGGPAGSGANIVDASVDASTGADSASDNDAATVIEPNPVRAVTLFPLASGNTWTYEGSVMSSALPDCTMTVSEQQSGTWYSTYDLEDGPCIGLGTLMLRAYLTHPTQIATHQNDRKAWYTLLEDPVEEGHQWFHLGDGPYTWHRVGTVTVTAGTFDECWQAVPSMQLEPTATTTYCNGVGPVEIIHTTMAYRGQLKSYSVAQ